MGWVTIEPLCFIFETNVTLFINDTLIFFKCTLNEIYRKLEIAEEKICEHEDTAIVPVVQLQVAKQLKFKKKGQMEAQKKSLKNFFQIS